MSVGNINEDCKMTNWDKMKAESAAKVYDAWVASGSQLCMVDWLRAEAVEVKPKWKRPDWFKVGAHVWIIWPDQNRGVTIESISTNETFIAKGINVSFGCSKELFDFGHITPARVRPWTLEEADAMIGRYVICVDGVAREITEASSRKMPGYTKSVWIRIEGENYSDSVSAKSCAETLRLESGEPCGTYERA